MTERLASVFGGTGFLGRRVVRALAEAGMHVRVVARNPDDAVFEGVDPARIERCRADIRDGDAVAGAVEGASAAVNAVSLYVEEGEATFDAVHVDGAASLADACREGGVDALVHVSGIGSDADSPSALIRAKTRGERAVRDGFPEAAVVRPSVMFGRGDAFVANLEKATRAPVVPLFGSGRVRMQPAWVRDVAEAIALLAGGAAPGDPGRGEALEFGGAETLSYREAVEAVCKHLGRRRLLVPFPMSGWKLLVRGMSVLPRPPLTVDQLYLLARDNTVDAARDGFERLAMQPRGLSELLGRCLERD